MKADLLILAGLSSLGYGFWQVSEPLAFVAVGSILLVLGVFMCRGE